MCPHRDFRDEDNIKWAAWDVTPSWGERRVTDRRSGSGGRPPNGRERRSGERRVVRGIRIALTPNLSRGWLAFESEGVRRRLAPIPPDWHLLPEDRLRELLRAAETLPQKRRRLIE